MERKDILVWRREHASKRGLYEYKLYGKFDDVTVWEFLAVQLDLSQYRHTWDTSTAQCREVETQKCDVTDTAVMKQEEVDDTAVMKQEEVDDNSVKKQEDSQGDEGDQTAQITHVPQNKSQAIVYYWEVKYPAFFSNRCRISIQIRVNFTFSLLNVFSHFAMTRPA